MATPLDALYEYALDRHDLTHWLPEDVAKEYGFILQYSEEQEKELLEQLTGAERTLFQRLMKNVNARQEAEQEMLFCQGVAMGLRLGLFSALG